MAESGAEERGGVVALDGEEENVVHRVDIDYIKHAVHHSVSIWHDLFEFW
jgi:hypothetical protein